jgi:hypothetical protein
MKFGRAVAFGVFVFGVGAANANLVINGSFENPYRVVVNNPLPEYSRAIEGWTVVESGAQVVSITNERATGFLNSTPLQFPASDGDQWLNIAYSGQYGKGVVSDDIPVIIGQRYLLSFDIGDRGPRAGDGGNNNVEVNFNFGATTVFTNFDTPGQMATMEWERFTLEWLADAPFARIGFVGLRSTVGPFANTVGIDNVVLEQIADIEPPAQPVAEPMSLALVGLGLLMLTGMRRLSSVRRQP